jgi:hypothetical protein
VTYQLTVQLGKPSLHTDPGESDMVLVDFPLSEQADAEWMSVFAARVRPSAADAWTVTGHSIRLRSRADAGDLRVAIAALRQVFAETTAAYAALTQPDADAGPSGLDSLQQVLDEEFGR